MRTIPLADRFWSKVLKTETCWLWQRQVNNKGYGRFAYFSRLEKPIGGVGLYAHRVSWMLANGPIPDGLYVLHRCDTPACVNPQHLFLGTQFDNMRDCASKSRMKRRGKPMKLRPDQIRAVLKDTRTYREIGETFGVTHGCIGYIKAKHSA